MKLIKQDLQVLDQMLQGLQIYRLQNHSDCLLFSDLKSLSYKGVWAPVHNLHSLFAVLGALAELLNNVV